MDENKIKREWLTALMAYISAYLGVGVICLRLVDFVSPGNVEAWINYAGGGFGISIVFGMLYWFAYSGGGTRYIAFYLFMQPFHALKELIDIPSMDFVELSIWLVFLGLRIWVWLKSYQLYKLNVYKKNLSKEVMS